MSSKKFAVIGHPIGHTMSPFIHKRLFALSSVDAEYGVLDIPPESLAKKFENTLKYLDGFNITIPHKQNIIPLIDKIDKKAKMYGSVNTVAVKDGETTGYTTDPHGFLMALDSAGIDIGGRTVILGCGGVARIMAYEVALKKAAVHFAVRREDASIAKALCDEITATVSGSSADFCLIPELEGDIDLLVNATPIGMFPKTDSQPVEDSVISKCAAVFDAIYNPLKTTLIKKALANGSKAAGGMAMLVWQAAVAQQKWYDVSFDPCDIEKICADASKELENK